MRPVPSISRQIAISSRCKELLPVIGRASEDVEVFFRVGVGALSRLSVVVVTEAGAWVVVVTDTGTVVVVVAGAVVVVVTAAADQRAYRVTLALLVGV